MVMKKIFFKEVDDEVHSAFLKYGRGEYKNKYLISVKKQKDKFVIKTSAEFSNFLIRKSLKNIGKIAIKGIIISTIDLKDEVEFPIVKASNFKGIRKIQIDSEIEANKILELMEKYPRFYFGLSFKTENILLKIKAKAPKNSKPGKGGEEPKADWCTLKTPDKTILKDLLFDVENFKEVTVNHEININQIIYPKDPTLNPKEIREQSKRKGIVKRKVILDGNEIISKAEFLA